eukprot:362353-Prymnesium_polylepis.3
MEPNVASFAEINVKSVKLGSRVLRAHSASGGWGEKRSQNPRRSFQVRCEGVSRRCAVTGVYFLLRHWHLPSG